MVETQILCSYCLEKPCATGDASRAPKFCPTLYREEALSKAKQLLQDTENQPMARDAARTREDVGQLTRIEETMLYARLRGYQKLGLAFCLSLSDEAQLLTNVLLNEGFEVVSACCTCGALCSDDIGLPEEEIFISRSRQPMCNPIGQAAILDGERCHLNILLGLCVGHDTLFIKHSRAPVTVLATKDRVLAHNPLGLLHTSRNPFSRMNTQRMAKQSE